eukprot:8062969-Pyramimonas_sp.AAC.1
MFRRGWLEDKFLQTSKQFNEPTAELERLLSVYDRRFFQKVEGEPPPKVGTTALRGQFGPSNASLEPAGREQQFSSDRCSSGCLPQASSQLHFADLVLFSLSAPALQSWRARVVLARPRAPAVLVLTRSSFRSSRGASASRARSDRRPKRQTFTCDDKLDQ